jgi:NAD(P)-dependent dehydrogenase (short-subunit alcohol dehydrogenase family)
VSIAVVTGAAGGIGLAIASRLAEAGHDVVGVDRVTGPELDGVRRVSTDVRDGASVRELLAQTASAGGIDALVCAAGVLGAGVLASMPDEALQETLDINLAATIRTCRDALPHLTDGGAVVLVGSVAGRVGGAPGVAVYAATKAGLEGFVRALACEVAPRGIRANLVAPGIIDAPMAALVRSVGDDRVAARIPLGRLGRPHEIAEVVEFLVSPRSSYVTGTVVTVDGGLLAHG